MKYPQNIEALGQLSVDYVGFIFFRGSARYVDDLRGDQLGVLPARIKRVGVFVDETVDRVLDIVSSFALDFVQLHGNESPEYCRQVKTKCPNVGIIKAFSVAQKSDLLNTKGYEAVCDFLLFDTKTPNVQGGSGQKFDWSILDAYTGSTPFFLSGGISAQDVQALRAVKHPKLFAIDVNSKFEIEPGLKDIERINKFINKVN